MDFDLVALLEIECVDNRGGQGDRQTVAPFRYSHGFLDRSICIKESLPDQALQGIAFHAAGTVSSPRGQGKQLFGIDAKRLRSRRSASQSHVSVALAPSCAGRTCSLYS